HLGLRWSSAKKAANNTDTGYTIYFDAQKAAVEVRQPSKACGCSKGTGRPQTLASARRKARSIGGAWAPAPRNAAVRSPGEPHSDRNPNQPTAVASAGSVGAPGQGRGETRRGNACHRERVADAVLALVRRRNRKGRPRASTH